jgi:quercetin dioxygenase-like cupin family protein
MQQESGAESVAVRSSAADTQGEAVVVEVRLGGHAHGMPLHVHPEQEERLQVLAGSLLLHVDGRELTIDAGERATVPAGTPHAYSNPAADVAHFVVETTPADGPTIEVA